MPIFIADEEEPPVSPTGTVNSVPEVQQPGQPQIQQVWLISRRSMVQSLCVSYYGHIFVHISKSSHICTRKNVYWCML